MRLRSDKRELRLRSSAKTKKSCMKVFNLIKNETQQKKLRKKIIKSKLNDNISLCNTEGILLIDDSTNRTALEECYTEHCQMPVAFATFQKKQQESIILSKTNCILNENTTNSSETKYYDENVVENIVSQNIPSPSSSSIVENEEIAGNFMIFLLLCTILTPNCVYF